MVTPGYKSSEIGEIPLDWEVRPLGRMIRSVEYGSSAKSSSQGTTPVLRMGNLQGGRIDWNDLVFTSDERETQRYLLRPGDVLFNRTNTVELVGKTSIYRGERPAIFAGYLIRVNVDESLLSPWYLNYVLNTAFSRAYSAKVLSVAIAQANINAQKLRTYPIPVPPTRAEQDAIAGALSDADALIEALEQLLVKKRQIKLGAMQELLTGRRRLPGFAGKWKTRHLGDLFTFSGGYTASRAQLSTNGYCYLHYGDIHTATRTFVDVCAEYQDIPKLDVPLNRVRPGSLLEDGDVVFVDASEDAEGTSKHVVVKNSGGVPFIAGLHTIVAKGRTEDLTHSYRRFCFQTSDIRRQFQFYAVGTKVSGMSKSNIVKLTLPVPSTEEQSAIATILSDMDAEIDALEARLTKARLLKQGMMQELLTGRIRLT